MLATTFLCEYTQKIQQTSFSQNFQVHQQSYIETAWQTKENNSFVITMAWNLGMFIATAATAATKHHQSGRVRT